MVKQMGNHSEIMLGKAMEKMKVTPKVMLTGNHSELRLEKMKVKNLVEKSAVAPSYLLCKVPSRVTLQSFSWLI